MMRTLPNLPLSKVYHVVELFKEYSKAQNKIIAQKDQSFTQNIIKIFQQTFTKTFQRVALDIEGVDENLLQDILDIAIQIPITNLRLNSLAAIKRLNSLQSLELQIFDSLIGFINDGFAQNPALIEYALLSGGKVMLMHSNAFLRQIMKLLLSKHDIPPQELS